MEWLAPSTASDFASTIVGSYPAFVHYATSSRARALLGVSPQWWTARALASFALRVCARAADKEHFWQGQPGLWRALLPASYTRELALPYHDHAERFHYDLIPDPALTLEEARRNWREVVRPPA